MPITINECIKCGKLPDWSWDDMGDGHADLMLYCNCQPDNLVSYGASLEEVVDGWNIWNKNDLGDKNDEWAI